MRKSQLSALVVCAVIVLVPLLAGAANPAYERDLIERVEAAFGEPGQRSEEMPQAPTKCGTPIVTEIHLAWQSLSPETQAAISARVQIERPILDESYDTPDGRFRIHYTRSGPDSVDLEQGIGEGGIPTYILTCADLLATTVAKMFDTLGFREPISDATGKPGENPRYDIYFQGLGGLFYGLTVPETAVESEGNPTYWTSWILLESDYKKLPTYLFRPFEAMAVTIAHELNHASQWSYDAREAEERGVDTVFAYPWFLELTSTAMEDLVFDNVNDYHAYLPSFYEFPWVSLRHFTTTSNHPYAASIWMIYLVEKLNREGKDGNSIPAAIWEECGQIAGFNTFEAFETVLQNLGTSFDAEWAEFLVWNYATKERAQDWGFSEGNLYPSIPSEQIVVYSDYPMSATTSLLDPPHPVDELGAQYALFVPPHSEVPQPFRMRLTPKSQFEEWMVVIAGLRGILPPEIRFWRDIGDTLEFAEWESYDELLVIVSPFKSQPVQEILDRGLGYMLEVSDSFPAAAGGPGFTKVYPNPLELTAGVGGSFQFVINRPTGGEASIHIYTLDGRLIRGGKENNDGGDDRSFLAAGVRGTSLSWSGRNRDQVYVASGIYLALIKVGGQTDVVKVAVKNGM